MGVVVDSSAALDLILGTDRAGEVDPVLVGGDRALHAPALIDTETLIVLRRYWLRGELSESRAGAALDVYERLPIRVHQMRPLLRRAWALKPGITASDALYVALAEALDAVFLTTDDRLARVIRETDGIATRSLLDDS